MPRHGSRRARRLLAGDAGFGVPARTPIPETGRTAWARMSIKMYRTRWCLVRMRRTKARRLVLAIPTAPESAWHTLCAEDDDGSCLVVASGFSPQAVGQYYESVDQTKGSEVIALLANAGQRNR